MRAKDTERYIEIYKKYYGVSLEPRIAEKRLSALIDFIEASITNVRKPMIKDEDGQKTNRTPTQL